KGAKKTAKYVTSLRFHRSFMRARLSYNQPSTPHVAQVANLQPVFSGGGGTQKLTTCATRVVWEATLSKEHHLKDY
ncbi:MAG: hypothetical protein DMF73_16120, partial [Acidobacteria bacterium]